MCIYIPYICSCTNRLLLLFSNTHTFFMNMTSQHLTTLCMYAAFYVYFPPVRSKPIRTLQFGESLVNIKGKWYFDLRKYKTSAKYGPQITELHKNLVCSSILPWLSCACSNSQPDHLTCKQVEPVQQYTKKYRKHLLNINENKEDHHMMFVNSKGNPISSSSWIKLIQGIFKV